MLLLKLLSEKDMYGYEMISTLRQRSQNVFKIKAGTLYPLLHAMRRKIFSGLMNRKYRARCGSITALPGREESSF